jgi:hypothetical protein
MQGEELRKQIGAAAYIEGSSKTQQVLAHVNSVVFLDTVCC